MSENQENFEVGQSTGFAMIPHALADDERLDIYDRAIFYALARFSNATKEDSIYPSYKTLSEMSGMSRRKAIDAMNRLIESGWVTKVVRKDGSRNFSSIYHLNNRPAPSAQHALPSARHAPPSAQHAPKEETLKNKQVKRREEEEAGETPAPIPQKTRTEDPSPSLRDLILEKTRMINPSFKPTHENLTFLTGLGINKEILADNIALWLRGEPQRTDLKFYIERRAFSGAIQESERRRSADDERDRLDAKYREHAAKQRQAEEEAAEWKTNMERIEAEERDGKNPTCHHCGSPLQRKTFNFVPGSSSSFWRCSKGCLENERIYPTLEDQPEYPPLQVVAS